jgi:hypothetical protein
MKQFTIQGNKYLTQNIVAFYHSDYHGGNTELRERTGTVENVICTLKNQFEDKDSYTLQTAANALIEILRTDLPQILRATGKNNLTVCVIPRAKAENFYSEDQKLFRKRISGTVDKLNGYSNGTTYIIRHTNTITTHMYKSGYGGDGDLPYPGITTKTCHISNEVKGKDILLIDDLYTQNVNIDEDCIQALLNKGAKSLTFYAVGKTMFSIKGDDKYAFIFYGKPFSALNSQEKEIMSISISDGRFDFFAKERYGKSFLELDSRQKENILILYARSYAKFDFFAKKIHGKPFSELDSRQKREIISVIHEIDFCAKSLYKKPYDELRNCLNFIKNLFY